ncbi:predicted protein [Plenodomus lingam JN3]|uniref:Predicted protein n=1 Tax=Leptosphaeria maculans (strain JN3 / isolate v23.1.3 / race Av1-4-5-6-7-8) TaxID=985895 RepID=E5A2S4_LEPMJ|nr:predicted protein [Plenodomus lingam JN3]CBX97870.1 predicted protein [Plenodomus lingam JN3]
MTRKQFGTLWKYESFAFMWASRMVTMPSGSQNMIEIDLPLPNSYFKDEARTNVNQNTSNVNMRMANHGNLHGCASGTYTSHLNGVRENTALQSITARSIQLMADCTKWGYYRYLSKHVKRRVLPVKVTSDIGIEQKTIIGRYDSGLPSVVHGSATSNEFRDQILEATANSKRKWDSKWPMQYPERLILPTYRESSATR